MASGIKTITEDGSLEGWLRGIQQVANGVVNYYKYEPPKPPSIPIDAFDDEAIAKLAVSKADNPEEINELESSIHQIIDRIKNYNGEIPSDYTKEELQQAFLDNFLLNPDVTYEQILETSKLTIENLDIKTNQAEADYYRNKYPNYQDFSAHQASVAFMHFLTGLPIKDLSDTLPGLGITGVAKWNLNIQATFSDKWRERTALHDVTDHLQETFKELGIPVKSWNKSVFGLSNKVVSAILGVGIIGTFEELFDSDLLDPLIIDLDSNGIELINLEESTTIFDVDADGYAENTTWTTDGILTFDLNQDGTINNITEIFSERFNDGSANSGLAALATLDSNNNGIISVADNQFNDILVWEDSNQNGISESDELSTLPELGITSINLQGIPTEQVQDGNIIRTRSIFNRNDGTLGEITDVAFLVTQTGFKVNQTENGIQIEAEDDTAASLIIFDDNENHTLNLAEAGVQIAIASSGNDTLFTTGNEDVFLSGDEGEDTLTGGPGNDSIIGGAGEDIITGNGGADVLFGGPDADTFIFTAVADSTTANPDVIEDFEPGRDRIDLTSLSYTSLDSLTITQNSETTTISANTDNFSLILNGQLTLTAGDFSFNGSNNNTIEGTEGDDTLNGTVGDDTINGGEGNDTIYGEEGDDHLRGNEGNDQLFGGSGLDVISGGTLQKLKSDFLS